VKLTGQFYYAVGPMAKEDKRQQIMKAAEKLFMTRRFHEIKMDEVAQAAKVGKGTLYLYFKDKEDLLFETVMSGLDELCKLLQDKVLESLPFEQQLLGLCAEIRNFCEARRELYQMIVAEEARMFFYVGNLGERWRQERQRIVSVVVSMIERGVAEGRVRKDIPPEVLAEFLLGMLRTRLVELANAPEEFRRDELVRELFCHGAGPAH
jgi:AcrR family transcriptional regulator